MHDERIRARMAVRANAPTATFQLGTSSLIETVGIDTEVGISNRNLCPRREIESLSFHLIIPEAHLGRQLAEANDAVKCNLGLRVISIPRQGITHARI